MAALVLTAAGSVVCRADSNPLIGNWVLSGPGYVDRDGNSWCTSIPRLTFTATAQTVYAAATKFKPAAQSTTPVHYLVNGSQVYVASEATFAGAPSYRITGPNKMESEDVGHCPFAKK
jgi:hypothetical protein